MRFAKIAFYIHIYILCIFIYLYSAVKVIVFGCKWKTILHRQPSILTSVLLGHVDLTAYISILSLATDVTGSTGLLFHNEQWYSLSLENIKGYLL